MKSDFDVARGWLRKAESDLANARLCLAADQALDTACFHCQQAAEKSLKAYLISRREPFPFVHDLDKLIDHCIAVEPRFESFRADALALNPFAVMNLDDSGYRCGTMSSSGRMPKSCERLWRPPKQSASSYSSSSQTRMEASDAA